MALVTDKTLHEKQCRRLTFEITKNGSVIRSHTLTINPEELTQREPARTEIIQTIGGAYVEDWGAGLIEFTIRGTTGYRKRNIEGRETDGFQEFKNLRSDIYRYFLNPEGASKRDSKDSYALNFYNWEDGEYYQIHPKNFQLNRSKQRPLLYTYDFSFVCLRPLGQRTPLVDTNEDLQAIVGEDEGRMVAHIREGLEGHANALVHVMQNLV